MSRQELKAQVQNLLAAVDSFRDWDAETDEPKLLEIEFDKYLKLAVVEDSDFLTLKIHRRVAGA